MILLLFINRVGNYQYQPLSILSLLITEYWDKIFLISHEMKNNTFFFQFCLKNIEIKRNLVI